MNLNLQGKSNLPDNIKILFRFISFNQPSFEKIAEILFLTEGLFIFIRFFKRKITSQENSLYL